MIKKINNMKDFGIFSDFSWDNLEDFKKFNLIYGWNYSGKTTLSRIFRSYELNEIYKDHDKATFEVEHEDGEKYDHSRLEEHPAIRVFNSDYIRENLKWEATEEGIEPVLLVGEENIKLEEELKKLEEELKKSTQRSYDIWGTVEIENKKIENGLTDKARNIRSTLNLPNFEKPQFKPFVEDVKDSPETTKLSNEQVRHFIQTYQSIEKKPDISEIAPSIPDMTSLSTQTQILLKRTATTKAIERLKKNRVLEKWVESGLGLHEDKKTCEFCCNELPDDLFDVYNRHFSTEYKILMKEIEQLIVNLKNEKINNELPDKARFYLEFQDDYEHSKEELETAVKTLNLSIDDMIRGLEDKKSKAFESIPFDIPRDNTGQLKTQIDAINALIQKHKDKTIAFETERDAAKDELIKHWASEFAIDIKYRETLEQIKTMENEIDDIRKEIAGIRSEIDDIQQKLSDAVKGAGKISEYLKGYFGTDEIKMKVTEDGKHFKLDRSGQPANNLSEGEKTAIAFSHFMAKLEEHDAKLEDTIIFIDDPVSSLDSNHLFYTYAFIETELTDCKQLLISTHNYEFFNLIKDWFGKVKASAGGRSFYLVEKTKAGEAVFKANLINLPKPLSSYRSEYVYLFSLLHKFNEDPQPNYDHLYILPNITRRYLEAYIGFRTLGGLNKNLSMLIEDGTQQKKVYKFVNAYSHNRSTPRLLYFPDFSECTDVIDIVITAVENKDEDHYKALIQNIA